MDRIYLDNQATTPVDPRVVDAMLPFFTHRFANPGSVHDMGADAKRAVDVARGHIAELLCAEPQDLIFTSGATEANNLALFGVLSEQSGTPTRMVTCATEHRAVLEPAAILGQRGADVTVVRPSREGEYSVDDFAAAVNEETRLVSVMVANNEIGTIQPLAEIASALKEVNPKILVHTDATQAVGKIPVDVGQLNVDLLSCSSHKLYGPKGIGALWIRPGLSRLMHPVVYGGGHERGLRAGTLNVPAIVGFGRACRIAGSEMIEEAGRVRGLRDRLLANLLRENEDLVVVGSMRARLPGNLNVAFPGVDSEAVLANVRGVIASTGAACSAATPEPSHVLRALGLGDDLLDSCVRFSIGRFNSGEEIEMAATRVSAGVRHYQAIAG